MVHTGAVPGGGPQQGETLEPGKGSIEGNINNCLNPQVAKREEQGHGQMWLAPTEEEREETTNNKQYIWLGPSWARPREHLASVPRSDRGAEMGNQEWNKN